MGRPADINRWKEKVRHDLVRPTTVIQGTRPERMVRTWGGPHRSSQTMIKRKDVEPYKRVMPHSEYPSGSSCLCQGIADYANAFLAATGVTMPPLQYVFASARVDLRARRQKKALSEALGADARQTERGARQTERDVVAGHTRCLSPRRRRVRTRTGRGRR